MKAVQFHKPKDMRVDVVPDPKIEQPDDVILKVTATAICGSDLHIYNGFLPQTEPMVMGHEFMGIIEEAGSGVKNLKVGDRVIIPFPIACGACFFCNHELPGHCEHSNPKKYGPEGGILDQKGGALFGYTDLYGGYSGGQAEYVRVPYANFGPRLAPENLSDEQLLFLTDIFPTGYSGVHWANAKAGDTVAVFGCGPVGIMAQKVATALGAARVIGVDIQDYRLRKAEQTAGSTTFNLNDCDVVEEIRALTEGRGADVCIDAVGMEADRTLRDKISNVFHAQAGSTKALQLAISAVRRGGSIGVLGVYGMPYDNFPLGQIFDKGIHLSFGQAPVHPFIDELIDWVKDGKIRLDDIITHRLPLAEAPHAYEIFNNKEDDCVKVVLNPFA
jgi:threonine dehydrogenase-like Zn-dependent dehydrogenase